MPTVTNDRNKNYKHVLAKQARMEKVAGFIAQGMSLKAAGIAAGEPSDKFDKYVQRHWWKDPYWKELNHRARRDAKLGLTETDGAGEAFPNFLAWRERFCAYEDHRSTERPKRVVKATNSFYQEDSYKHLRENNRLLIVLPPGHIKTSMFAIEHSVYSIMRDRNIRILVVQKNADEAEKIVMECAARLSDHDYYHNLADRLKAQGDEPIECPLCVFGDDFKPDVRKSGGGRWSAEGFRVQGVTSGEKDMTLQAKGVGSQIQGIRSDIIVLDDVQDPDLAVHSVADSEKKMGWFQRVILGRVTEAQKVIVLANYFDDNDFAHRVEALFEDELGVPTITYPAVIDDKGKRRPLCPEYWTLKALDQKHKEVGERTWFYTWMQEVGSFDDTTFRRETLNLSRDEEFYLGTVPPACTHVFLGVDPAVSVNGFCSIVAWGLDARSKRRFLIDVFNKKGMLHWDNVVRQIVQMTAAYQPRVVVIELASTQGSLADNPALRRELRSLGAKVNVYKTATGTGARSEQLNFDITTIGGLFEAGLVSLPYAGPQDEREKIDGYIDQLVKWRTDESGNSVKHLTRDMVMATLFAESEAFEIARRESLPQKRPRRKVPRWGVNADGDYAWKQPVRDPHQRIRVRA